MPRRGNIPKRENAPDAVYGSVMVTKLINNVMLDGKKSLAEKIVYEALETVREKTGKDPAELLDQAMKNIMPVLEVRPRRVGGATYQVPVEVRPERRVSLGLRWLVRFAQARGEKTMVEKLAGEMMDAANGTGGAVRRREETHRMAEANKAFAHYRW
ncbi:MAG: 30S ribosomal protein S7 [Limnochordia bacterium]|jgi:small subunit ribosomal protein S7|nr:30S ribosomal protein S7 [Bacillota bacterium]